MFNARIEELEPANVPKMKRKPLTDKRGTVTCAYGAQALSGTEMKSLRAAVVAGLAAKPKATSSSKAKKPKSARKRSS